MDDMGTGILFREWSQRLVFMEIRQEAYRILKEEVMDYRMSEHAWKGVCMLERQNVSGGLLSLEEILPEIYEINPDVYQCADIKEVVLLMEDGADLDDCLEMLANRYHIWKSVIEIVPVFYLYMQCMADIWDYNRQAKKEKVAEDYLKEIMARLPRFTWMYCIKIAGTGDLHELFELEKRITGRKEYESNIDMTKANAGKDDTDSISCHNRTMDEVYEWLEKTRKELFPLIVDEYKQNEKRWERLVKKILLLSDVAEMWGLESLVHEGRQLAECGDRDLSLLGDGCSDKEELLDGHFALKIIKIYEASDWVDADRIAAYLSLRGLVAIWQGSSKKVIEPLLQSICYP